MNGPEAAIEAGRRARELGAVVEMVGTWAWARFTVRPPEETRQAMKELGFYWNRKRSLWQHSGGMYRKRSPEKTGELRARLGVVPIQELDA